MSSTLAVQVDPALIAAAKLKMELAAQHLSSLQQEDGHWCALLTADTM